MENEKDYNKKYKIVSIIAIFLSVVGLSLGYAAYTQTLNITMMGNVIPPDKFSDKIYYNNNVDISYIDDGNDLEHDSGDLTGNEWKNIYVEFTEPGQSASFKANIRNDSEFTAFLSGIVTLKGLETALGEETEHLSKDTIWTAEQIANYSVNFKIKLYLEKNGSKELLGIINNNATNINCEINSKIDKNDNANIIIEFDYDENAEPVDFPVAILVPTIKLEWSTYNSASKSCN